MSMSDGSTSDAGAPVNQATSRTVPPGPNQPDRVEIYDTTLRDGAQLEGISLTVDDKLRIAQQLDSLGVHYIEGGWPGSNPKDDEFFARVPTELDLTTSELVAFGSTRRVNGSAADDPTLEHLVKAGTSTVCIVGKCWDYHVTEALRTSLDEGVAMVRDSVEFLAAAGLRVFFDAEHLFDGYARSPEFSLRVLEGAVEGGAAALVLCDTNGGSLPADVERIVGEIYAHFDGAAALGVHLHDDTGCGVANALAGVRAGATQVQGTINGYGERTGNCNLTTIIPNLALKMGVETIPADRLELLTPVAHHVAELVNITMNPQQAYVGSSAFAHKAGLHTSAISRRSDAYEHLSPDLVGNGTRFVVSELAGKSTIVLKAQELGLEMDGAALTHVTDQLKALEHEGFHFEAADGSLELLMRRAGGWEQTFFTLESWRVTVEHRPDLDGDGQPDLTTEATVKVAVDGERRIETAEGNGPVNALDAALRKAVGELLPALGRLHLTDYKVRVLDTGKGTGAVTRVLIDSTDGERSWSTIGVSENVIEASWQALFDSIVFGLLHAADGGPMPPAGSSGPTTPAA
jgi:2-isopropylmalate synthase